MPAPFLSSVRLDPGVPLDRTTFPGNLRFAADLHLKLESPVTFFVGENGSGKSTLLEAMAVLAGFPIAGGGVNDIADSRGVHEESLLASHLRMAFTRRPRDGYFFRAELQTHFASLLDARDKDPEFSGNPYTRYGGRSLHTLSHGEAFLAVLRNRVDAGLYLLDEPESALSPQRQLALLALMHSSVEQGTAQFLIATHSPILLTYPGARIVSFDGDRLEPIPLEETSHYQITRGILTSPGSYWKHLREPDA